MPVEKISSLKKELTSLSQKELLEICLKTARLKAENKEFITYLVYYKDDPLQYAAYVKEELSVLLEDFKDGPHAYKTLRKGMRMIAKFKRFTRSKHGTADLYVHLIEAILAKSNGKYSRSTHVLTRSMEMLGTVIPSLEDDLQFDYEREFSQLAEKIKSHVKEKSSFSFRIFK